MVALVRASICHPAGNSTLLVIVPGIPGVAFPDLVVIRTDPYRCLDIELTRHPPARFLSFRAAIGTFALKLVTRKCRAADTGRDPCGAPFLAASEGAANRIRMGRKTATDSSGCTRKGLNCRRTPRCPFAKTCPQPDRNSGPGSSRARFPH